MSDDVFPVDVPTAPVTNPGRYLTRRFPEWDVDNKIMLSGKRFGITWALEPRVTYSLTEDCLRSFTPQEYQELLSFAGSHFGPLDSFLFPDPEDSSASDPTVQGGGMCFGIGDGTKTTFQLQRRVNALRRDRNSGIKYRSSSGPRTNFLLWSNDLTNAVWTKSTGVVAALDGIAPDNTPSSVLAYNGSGSAGGARCSQAVTAASATPFCTSGFLRADVPVNIALGNAAGIVSTVTLTTSWQRVDWNVTPAIGGDVGLVIYSPAGVNTAFRIYFWQGITEPDVSNSGTPTKPIPTTTTALTQNPQLWPAFADSFLPVYELNGSAVPAQIFRQDWQGVVQLLPRARTNLVLQSNTFGNATWTKTNTSTGGAVTGPDGAASAIPVTGITSAGGSLTQSVGGLVVGQTYTYSWWLRCALGASLTFGVTSNTGAIAITSNFQRFTRTFVATATSTTATLSGWAIGQVVECSYTQLEMGTMATANILTLTVAITAPADYSITLGLVTLAVAPLTGAILSWLGSYFIRVYLDDTAQKGVELNRVVANIWKSTFQLVSVVP